MDVRPSPIATLFVVGALASASLGLLRADETFTGTISDDMCGLNHAAMRMGPTEADCTHACVQEHDGAYVLADKSRIYRLSDQAAAKPFAGRKVRVTGTLDKGTRTIAVTSIAGE
jgi:hypothetical protein